MTTYELLVKYLKGLDIQERQIKTKGMYSKGHIWIRSDMTDKEKEKTLISLLLCIDT